jgi:citronellol/citronellal dehydrogenase
VTLQPYLPQRAAAWKVNDVAVLADGALLGQRAIVTGAGTGIGRAIAVRLVALGAEVVGLGRRVDMLEETGRIVAGAAGSYVFRQVDLRQPERSRTVVVEAAEAGLDLLVNNAGGQFYAATSDITDNGFRAVIDLNLNAVFTLISAAQPFLARRGGSIVNISLSGVDRGSVGMAHSISARGGVLALTRAIALEWAHLGIRTNCIGPGVVISDQMPPDVRDSLSNDTVPEAVPAGRATPVEDIAELVAFLASRAGRMMTGQMIQIDGGAHLGRGLHMLAGWPPSAS